jgi:hypothetical protein
MLLPSGTGDDGILALKTTLGSRHCVLLVGWELLQGLS